MHRQENKQINYVAKFHKIHLVANLNFLQYEWLHIIKHIQHLILLQLLPDRQRHQVVLLKLLRVKQSILERRQHPKINVLLVHFGNYLMLALVQYLLIVDFVKVLQIDFVFILDGIVDEAVARSELFGDGWRFVTYFRLVVELLIVGPEKQVLDLLDVV